MYSKRMWDSEYFYLIKKMFIVDTKIIKRCISITKGRKKAKSVPAAALQNIRQPSWFFYN